MNQLCLPSVESFELKQLGMARQLLTGTSYTRSMQGVEGDWDSMHSPKRLKIGYRRNRLSSGYEKNRLLNFPLSGFVTTTYRIKCGMMKR